MKSIARFAELLGPLLAALLAGCGEASPSSIGRSAEGVVYGDDGRAEFFEASSAVQSLMAESIVALIPRSRLVDNRVASLADAPTYAEAQGLCEGERFGEQPAAAFCSGVLVDWDLVLTAGHCLRAYALDDFVLAFDYYWRAPGELAVAADSLRRPVEIVAERLDREGAEPRIDYGWLRLDRPADAESRRPAAVYRQPRPVHEGDEVVSIGASGGVPLKADAGGRVADVRAEALDWFSASSDTSHGDSGGGAFDAQRALVGSLSRGGNDFVATEEGCLTTARVSEGEAIEEQFTYAQRAIEGLCENSDSSLCRLDCDEPCPALPLSRPRADTDSCAVAAAGSPTPPAWPFVVLVAAVLTQRRRRRRLPSATRPSVSARRGRYRPSSA